MNNAIQPILEYQGDLIRTTPSGDISLFDFIFVVGGCKSPREVWNRLLKNYPEYCHISAQYSFGGKGGAAKKTPVANKEQILQVLSALPGAAGKRYRQEAAKIVLAFFDAPAELALAAIDRTENPVDLKRIQARVDAKVSNKALNSAIQSAGGTCFAAVANINNIAIVGATAKEIQAIRGVKKTRDGLSSAELAMLNATEIYEQQAISSNNIKGDNSIILKCQSIADIMASARISVLALS